mmetsp:Transcript_12906/g.36306  ORF Transcript_12906/g.36306 Transcript_12906/m.36306 type:complete len:590 (+) Transcript_12906:148-1917(+)|eukprot:CAMPEP_0117657372 /NCGR_PEP_ID=MMETSP0804-20121206/5294_1 /TAXON_ID=1074897 /ORGANISM="Tetraselmis astigmatica, Strain CCMP880" /LENGTH=589 /DNA_ID=CAMNT_0005463819 /DNA_START=60 /DNA_END=1829 /DNA_ORIENTATION=+
MAGKSEAKAAPPRGELAAPAPKRNKRAPVDEDGTSSKEERFISRLAALLQSQGPKEAAALRTASAVHEALAQAVDALPAGKPLKAKLQDNLQGYGHLLAKLLGIAQPGAAPCDPVTAATRSRCALFLDDVYSSQLHHADLASADLSKLHSLLLARVPIPTSLLRACICRQPGSALSSVTTLRAAIVLCSALTPVAPLPGSEEGYITCVSELAEEALVDVLRGQEEPSSLASALSCFFAGRAVRMHRLQQAHGATDVASNLGLAANQSSASSAALRSSACAVAGRLLLTQAAVTAMQAGLIGRDGALLNTTPPDSGSPASVVVSAVASAVPPLGCSSWQGGANLLLQPELPWPGGTLPQPSEELIWQAICDGLEASHSVSPLAALWDSRLPSSSSNGSVDLVQIYLTRVLLHKRSLTRGKTSGGIRRKARTLKLPSAILNLPPPVTLCEWLRNQPLSQTVAAALAVVDRQPQDLTGHLLLRMQDKEVTALLKLWQASHPAELGGPPAAEAAGRPQDLAEENQDEDTLFFVDTKGEALSHFGRSWERVEEDDEDSKDGSSSDDRDGSDSEDGGSASEEEKEDGEESDAGSD